MGYTRTALKGLSWMSVGRFVMRALTFLKILVLARVLTPAQFGIFGIATLMLSLLETFTETGINIVLIQTSGSLTEYVNSAWVVSIIRGTLIATGIAISASFVASFFHSPSALGILYFMSLIPLVRGFINPAEIKFQKELQFGKQFLFTSFLYLVDACAGMIIALLTHSVYSLAWGMLLSAVLEALLSFALIKPRPRFKIEKSYFAEIFRNGIWITAYTTFNYIAENADNAVVGRVLGTTSLGFYQMAYKISLLPITEISEVINKVTFPVFSKIAGHAQRLRIAFLKTLSLMFFGSFILGAVIYFFPKQIIIILLGSKWLSISLVLQVLIIYGVLRTIGASASSVLLALKRQKDITITNMTRLIVLVGSIFPLIHMYGLIGAGYAQILSVLFEIPLILYYVFHALNMEAGK